MNRNPLKRKRRIFEISNRGTFLDICHDTRTNEVYYYDYRDYSVEKECDTHRYKFQKVMEKKKLYRFFEYGISMGECVRFVPTNKLPPAVQEFAFTEFLKYIFE